MPLIESQNLCFRYRKSEIIPDNINLLVPEGSVYAFLGPNGAGKTTTLKLLLGLLKPESGNIRIFSEDLKTNRVNILRRIGSLIESPSVYANLTAKENLAVYGRLYNIGDARVKEVLEMVGLSECGRKKSGHFSLGMKQRLSIGIALLHHPELLILDEPTNGLDPAGMVEIRELIRQLHSQQKTTIIISSHLLSEVEKIATHVGIINHGKLLFQGSAAMLKEHKQAGSTIQFEVSEPAKAMGLFSALQLPAEQNGCLLRIPFSDRKQIARINKELVESGIDVFEIRQADNDLESIFVQLTQNDNDNIH